MNINSKFNNIEDIKNFLNTLNHGNWKAEEISPDKIQTFIAGHLKIIENEQDRELQDQLMNLSDRLSREWNNPKANTLAHEIMVIAKGVFNKSDEAAPQLPNEIWSNIFSHIPPSAPGSPQSPPIRYKRGGIPSGLEQTRASKKLNEIAQTEENKWAGEVLVSLKKYGCKTASEAVHYAIEKQLTGVNLVEFPDLEEGDLKLLFEKCPNLNHLMIKSDRITSLPPDAKNLKTLTCKECFNLQSLPDLTEVKELNCSLCFSLQKIGQLSKVQDFNCSHCRSLQSLPELPQVEVLYCDHCESLESLPELPLVKELLCYECLNLENLPKLPEGARVVR